MLQCITTVTHTNTYDESSDPTTTRHVSCGKVIFSVVCVSQSVCSQEVPLVTITQDALTLTAQSSFYTGLSIDLITRPLRTEPHPLLVTSGIQLNTGDLFKPDNLRISLYNSDPPPPPTGTDICSTYSGQECGTHPTGMLSCYRPQRSCGKVMFLHLCVILFTEGVWQRTVRILLECILVFSPFTLSKSQRFVYCT